MIDLEFYFKNLLKFVYDFHYFRILVPRQSIFFNVTEDYSSRISIVLWLFATFLIIQLQHFWSFDFVVYSRWWYPQNLISSTQWNSWINYNLRLIPSLFISTLVSRSDRLREEVLEQQQSKRDKHQRDKIHSKHIETAGLPNHYLYPHYYSDLTISQNKIWNNNN